MATITTSGHWTHVSPVLPQLQGIQTSRLSWGLQCHRSGYQFDGLTAAPSPLPATPFKLGTFTHSHFPTCGGAPGPFTAILRVTLTAHPDQPGEQEETTQQFDLSFAYKAHLGEGGQVAGELVVTVADPGQAGAAAALRLHGFCHAGDGVSRFTSQPGRVTRADILTTLVPIARPAPQRAGPAAGPSGRTAAGPTSAATCQEKLSLAPQARDIVRRSTGWALGLGLIPVPVVDFLALTGIQVKMIKDLSGLYQVRFTEDRARAAVAGLVTALSSLSLTYAFARSLLKIVPGLGCLVGTVGASAFGGAFTLAVGKLFTMHFESGGTLLDFDPVRMRDHFRREFEQAKTAARDLQQEGLAGGGPQAG